MKFITKDNFKEEISKGVVVVDMYADWCGPCRALGPMLEEISATDEMKDVSFVKLDVDAAPELSQEYGVMSIPCIVYFKDGKEVGRTVGFYPDKQMYINEVNKAKAA